MPGNSASRCAAITCSSGTKRVAVGQRDEAGEQRRHLHPGEPLLAGRRVAHDDREVQRQVRDVRERVRGVDGERREHREDASSNIARELRLRRRRRGRPSRRTRCRRPASAGATSLVNTRGLAGDELLDPGADRAQLLDLVEAVGRRGAHAGRELLLQAGDAHLEELVEVRAEDREELRPLEQRQRRVLGEREHARVEVEPRQLAVRGTADPRRSAGESAGRRRAHGHECDGPTAPAVAPARAGRPDRPDGAIAPVRTAFGPRRDRRYLR